MRGYLVGQDGLCHADIPEPDDPGSNEVLIEVKAVSLNYRDLLVARGKYGKAPPEPFIAGSDMAGTVLKVGCDVTRFREGTAVLNAPFKHWPAGKINGDWMQSLIGGAGVNGILAERVCFPADALVPMPSHFSFHEGATLPIAGLTAWAGVMTHGQVKPGERVLLHGTGGVSIFAAQIARIAGAQVIMTTSSEEKAEVVKERFGVSETFDYRDESWPKQVRAYTDGRGVDLVVDVAGGQTFTQSLKACALNARISLIGILDGYESVLNPFDIIGRQIQIRGIYMESAQELAALARACEIAQLKPCIDRVFSLDHTLEAYEYLESQQHIGKIVIGMTS